MKLTMMMLMTTMMLISNITEGLKMCCWRFFLRTPLPPLPPPPKAPPPPLPHPSLDLPVYYSATL
eukprot:425379-Karenia_brevis.AAC.1